jgi:hypothetical protein
MARGRALIEDVLPLLETGLLAERDGHSAERFQAMCDRYASVIERERLRLRDGPAIADDDGRTAAG